MNDDYLNDGDYVYLTEGGADPATYYVALTRTPSIGTIRVRVINDLSNRVAKVVSVLSSPGPLTPVLYVENPEDVPSKYRRYLN